MRHYKKGKRLGTDASHTKAMKKSLVCALFENDRIKTTELRAKEIRGDVDRVITWAKKGDLHSRRLAIAKMGDKELVREVFEKVEQGMFKDRPGGYTRIMKLGYRKGDNAKIVIMELVTEPVQFKDTDKAPATKGAAVAAAAAKAEEVAEDIEAKAEEVADKVEEAKEDLEEKVEEAKADLEEKVEEVKEDLAEKAEEVKAEVEEDIADAKEAVEEVVEEAKEAVEEAAEAAEEKAE